MTYAPAVIIDLKHDFWSILGHSTYFAAGRSCFIVRRHKTSAIPVAIGTTKHDEAEVTPGRGNSHVAPNVNYFSESNKNICEISSPDTIYSQMLISSCHQYLWIDEHHSDSQLK